MAMMIQMRTTAVMMALMRTSLVKGLQIHEWSLEDNVRLDLSAAVALVLCTKSLLCFSSCWQGVGCCAARGDAKDCLLADNLYRIKPR